MMTLNKCSGTCGLWRINTWLNLGFEVYIEIYCFGYHGGPFYSVGKSQKKMEE